MNKSQAGNNNSLRDSYLMGLISIDDYAKKILNSKEGDRNRRKLEKKHENIVRKLLW